MQELPILRNSAGRAIRIMGVPDGPAHLSVIRDGKVISTHPVKWRYMPKEFEDTMPTQPAAFDEPHRTGRHNYPEPDWEAQWTKRLLFAAIIVAVAAVLLAIAI